MPNRINLYVVDDHALFREGLLRLLQHDAKMRVVGGTGSVEEALRQISEMRVDILILDYDLGDETALVIARALREKSFAGRILIVTAGLPNQDALELIRLGIFGIIHKHQPPAELYRSILSVAEGKVLIEQEYLQRLVADATTAKSLQPRSRLTDRDRQVLRLVLEGLSNKEIAGQLSISESAVKSSLQQLFAKTGVRTRGHLVRIALEELREELREEL